jgi:hypothetical protein
MIWTSERRPGGSRRPLAWLTLTAALLIALPSPAARAARAARDGTPLTVAVLYFDNHTGDARWAPLQKGLADMMVTDPGGHAGADGGRARAPAGRCAADGAGRLPVTATQRRTC